MLSGEESDYVKNEDAYIEGDDHSGQSFFQKALQVVGFLFKASDQTVTGKEEKNTDQADAEIFQKDKDACIFRTNRLYQMMQDNQHCKKSQNSFGLR